MPVCVWRHKRERAAAAAVRTLILDRRDTPSARARVADPTAATECARVVRILHGRIARVVVFLLLQVVCIHPVVSYRIDVARAARAERDDASDGVDETMSTLGIARVVSDPTDNSVRGVAASLAAAHHRGSMR